MHFVCLSLRMELASSPTDVFPDNGRDRLSIILLLYFIIMLPHKNQTPNDCVDKLVRNATPIKSMMLAHTN